MSDLYGALKRAEVEQQHLGLHMPDSGQSEPILRRALGGPLDPKELCTQSATVAANERLVAWTEPRGLGAEKFRALVARLENWRGPRELKSMQVISSVINEGKTLIAGNLAVTLARSDRYKVLLIEGDLHRPMTGSLFGLKNLQGIGEWWVGKNEFPTFLYQLSDMPLWFLPAGKATDQPSEVLQSERFTKAFTQLIGSFDWIVVDSTPMLPVVDANLWSRLVDGTLLVVREGIAPVHVLKKGLESLDNPKLIGTILNEASELSHGNYKYSYYGSQPDK